MTPSLVRIINYQDRFVLHNVLDMRRPFRSRCFGTCHFCIKTSPHGYKLHAIVRKLQELKLRYSVISYLSYHNFNISDDLLKSDISYFLSITVPSAVRIRRPPSASALYRVPFLKYNIRFIEIFPVTSRLGHVELFISVVGKDTTSLDVSY